MVMPYQMLVDAVRGRAPILRATQPIRDDQFQPATIDLRLGKKIYALSTTFLPKRDGSVEDMIAELEHYSFDLQEDRTHHLDVGKVYIVPLMESCEFPDNTRMFFSPKSSIGRNDVFVRIISEGYHRYDRTRYGYRGKLWAEIIPQSFHVGVRAGLPMVQGRIKTKDSQTLSTDELYHLHEKYAVVLDKRGKPLSPQALRVEDGRAEFHIDLERDVIGFRAKRRVKERLDLTAQENTYDPRRFWEPLYRSGEGHLILDPGEFYLFATLERIHIPPECCGELVQIDPGLGEFRVHYAGFFDNGFGGRDGTHGVLEVRASSVPFLLTHGNPVCAMEFERTFQVPEKLYGTSSHYTQAAPSLSKIFSHRYDAWELKYQTSRF